MNGNGEKVHIASLTDRDQLDNVVEDLKALGLPVRVMQNLCLIFIDSDDEELLNKARELPGVRKIEKNRKLIL